MRFLLDTHTAIWATTEPERLPSAIYGMLKAVESVVYVSVATIWEISIKRPLGRNDAPPMSASDAADMFEQANFIMLDITRSHAVAVASLPLIHFDPFDRLIVAQALTEPLRLVTHDAKLAAYSDTIITF